MIVIKATTDGVNAMAKTAKPFELTVTCRRESSQLATIFHSFQGADRLLGTVLINSPDYLSSCTKYCQTNLACWETSNSRRTCQ